MFDLQFDPVFLFRYFSNTECLKHNIGRVVKSVNTPFFFDEHQERDAGTALPD